MVTSEIISLAAVGLPGSDSPLLWMVVTGLILLLTGLAGYLGYRHGLSQAGASRKPMPSLPEVTSATHLESDVSAFKSGQNDENQRNESQRWTELLNIIFHTTTDAVFVKDRQGRYIMANEATAQSVGKALHEVIGHDDRDLFIPEHAEFLMARDQQIMASGHSETSEEELEAAGIKRTYLAMKAPYRNSQGEVIGLIGISRDITPRKAAEERLRQSALEMQRHREQLAHAQGIADLGRWSWEPESGLVEWSPELYRRYGVEPGKFVPSAESYFSLVHPDDLAHVQASVQRIVESGDLLEYDTRIVRPDGHVVWIHALARAYRDAAGKLLRVEGIDQDITSRKRLEQELNQTQKMEAIARLAGGIAHDFNNLLTVIKGYCELLLHHNHRLGSLFQPAISSSKPAIDFERSLKEISKAGDRAARLTEQLLAYSRHVNVVPQHLDINTTVRAACHRLPQLCPDQPVVELSLADQLPTVLADVHQLEHLIINLIVTAHDTMPEEKPLRLTTQWLRFDQPLGHDQHVKPGKYLVMSVGQSAPATDPQPSSPTSQMMFADSTRGLTSGLGLSIVHGVACQCGGYVGLENKDNNGLVFHLLLPAE